MKTKHIYIYIALGVGVIVSLSFLVGLFSGLELFLEDRLVRERPIDSRIVIVSIDDESIQRIGQWPWPRAVFAEALENLAHYDPIVVGIDVLFSEQSRLGAIDDEFLARTLAGLSYPVVLPFEQKEGAPLVPLSLFADQQSVSTGYVNLALDRDGVVRNIPFFEGVRPFGYEVAARADSPTEFTRLNLVKNERIVYAAPPGAIRRVPFWRLLSDSDSLDLEGSIVFIGATAPSLQDTKPTPFSRGEEMPGVEIQAHVANMVLSGYWLESLPLGKMTGWIFAAAFAPLIIGFVTRRKFLPFLGGNAVIGFLYLVGAIILFERGIVANIIHPQMAWLLSTVTLGGYRYWTSEKEKRAMRELFSKYVSDSVLAEILRDPARVQLGGEEKEITVFFSDIRGFTTLSEQTQPKELVSILNRYFTEMTEEVLKAGGVVDKYIGDAIMAFWGAPLDDESQADHAVQASRAMIKKLETLNEQFRNQGTPEINIGIGIYTGPAIVGNVGSAKRFDYTVIGDTVNAASRLEGLNKEYKTQIIIGESTKNKLKGSYNLRSLGQATVKGRKESITIHSVE